MLTCTCGIEEYSGIHTKQQLAKNAEPIVLDLGRSISTLASSATDIFSHRVVGIEICSEEACSSEYIKYKCLS